MRLPWRMSHGGVVRVNLEPFDQATRRDRSNFPADVALLSELGRDRLMFAALASIIPRIHDRFAPAIAGRKNQHPKIVASATMLAEASIDRLRLT